MSKCKCKHWDICTDTMAYPGNCKDFEEELEMVIFRFYFYKNPDMGSGDIGTKCYIAADTEWEAIEQVEDFNHMSMGIQMINNGDIPDILKNLQETAETSRELYNRLLEIQNKVIIV